MAGVPVKIPIKKKVTHSWRNIRSVSRSRFQNAAVDFRRRMKPSALLRCIEQISTDQRLCLWHGRCVFCPAKSGVPVGETGAPVCAGAPPGGADDPDHLCGAEPPGFSSVLPSCGGRTASWQPWWMPGGSLVDTESQHILRQPGWQAPEHYWNQQVEAELPLHVHKAEPLTSAGVWRADYSLWIRMAI